MKALLLKVWRAFFPGLPDGRAVLQAQLAEALRERAVAAVVRERAVAEERMLNERVARLQKELAS